MELVDSKLANWKKKFDNPEKETEDLYTEMLEELENNRKTSQHKNNLVREEIEEMRKYIRKLNRDQTTHVRGTPIPQLQSKQAQNRKVKELTARAQKALHFVQLFGLELECLKLEEKDGPRTLSIGFQTESWKSSQSAFDNSTYCTPPTPTPRSTTPPTTGQPLSGPRNVTSTNPPCVAEICSPPADTPSESGKRYASLNDNDKATVESLLLLMDKWIKLLLSMVLRPEKNYQKA